MENAAHAVLLLLLAIMAVQLFQGGPNQLKAWIESKFLGKTSRKLSK
jgi:hypothetical protein